MPNKRLTAGLLTAAATAGVLAASTGPASAGVDLNACTRSYTYNTLNNSSAFTTETSGREIQSRTAFYKTDGSLYKATSWYNHGFQSSGVSLWYKFKWTGLHPEAYYSRTFWRAMNSDGTIYRTWGSGYDYC